MCCILTFKHRLVYINNLINIIDIFRTIVPTNSIPLQPYDCLIMTDGAGNKR